MLSLRLPLFTVTVAAALNSGCTKDPTGPSSPPEAVSAPAIPRKGDADKKKTDADKKKADAEKAKALDARIDSMTAVAFGGGKCGSLRGGTALLCSGDNFESFSDAACVLGRNHLHPLVIDTIEDAYTSLDVAHPNRRWQFGDFGWKAGGQLRPHKTHQNGLSADFFVPVVNAKRAPDLVPIEYGNKFGYGVEFDAKGVHGDLEIDWKALTDHLLALEESGKAYRTKIRRVILAPELRNLLIKKDPRARRFASRFSKRKSWVRHDEHYHVDFDIPSKLKRPLSCD